jgi:hypothetical protein
LTEEREIMISISINEKFNRKKGNWKEGFSDNISLSEEGRETDIILRFNERVP